MKLPTLLLMTGLAFNSCTDPVQNKDALESLDRRTEELAPPLNIDELFLNQSVEEVKPTLPEKVKCSPGDFDCRFKTREFQVEQCSMYRNSDQQFLDEILKGLTTDQIHMYGLLTMDRKPEPRNIQFMITLLSFYQQYGWDTLAIEGEQDLNQYVGMPQLGEELQKRYGYRQELYAPIITTALNLGMKVVFYTKSFEEYTPRKESEWNRSSFEYLKTILDSKPGQKLVIVGSGDQAADYEYAERSFLEPWPEKPVGYFAKEYTLKHNTRFRNVIVGWDKHSTRQFNSDSYFRLDHGCENLIAPDLVANHQLFSFDRIPLPVKESDPLVLPPYELEVKLPEK